MAIQLNGAKISNAEPRAPGLAGEPTTYHISVVDKEDRTWSVHKRFTDFMTLEKELCEASARSDPYQLEGGCRPKLPAKGLMGFRHRFNLGEFNQKRQKGLDIYLVKLVEHLSQSHDKDTISIVASFLCPAECMIDKTKSASRDASVDRRTLTTDSMPSIAASLKLLVTPRREESDPEPEPQLNNMENSTKNETTPSNEDQITTTEDSTAAQKKQSIGSRATSREHSPTIRKKSSIPPQRKSVVAPLALAKLPVNSPEWLRLSAAHPEFAKAITRCEEISKQASGYISDGEEVFAALRRGIRVIARGKGEIALDEVLGKTVVWFFLLKVGSERPFFRSQCEETVQILEMSAAWRSAFEEHPEYVQLRTILQS